jgi:hypothetical protein
MVNQEICTCVLFFRAKSKCSRPNSHAAARVSAGGDWSSRALTHGNLILTMEHARSKKYSIAIAIWVSSCKQILVSWQLAGSNRTAPTTILSDQQLLKYPKKEPQSTDASAYHTSTLQMPMRLAYVRVRVFARTRVRSLCSRPRTYVSPSRFFIVLES